jgi:ribosomal protein S18 acetylase RimI-like enzyme
MQTRFLFSKSNILLKPATETDLEFQLTLYADTRSDEMSLVNWTDDQKHTFLSQQFQAQTKHYQINFPASTTKIIQLDDQPVGRLILNITETYIHIIDIALLFKYRNMGIGSILLKDLMKDATSLKLPIVLRVEIFNPAIHLYQRLGFEKTRSLEVYQEMVWTPLSQSPKQ